MGPAALRGTRQALLPPETLRLRDPGLLGPRSLSCPPALPRPQPPPRSKVPRFAASPAQSGPGAADGFSPRRPAPLWPRTASLRAAPPSLTCGCLCFAGSFLIRTCLGTICAPWSPSSLASHPRSPEISFPLFGFLPHLLTSPCRLSHLLLSSYFLLYFSLPTASFPVTHPWLRPFCPHS